MKLLQIKSETMKTFKPILFLLILFSCACTKPHAQDGVIPSGSSLNAPGTGGITGNIQPSVICKVEALQVITHATIGYTNSNTDGSFFIKSLPPNDYNLKFTPINQADLQQYGVYKLPTILPVSQGANVSSGNIPLN